MRWPLLGLDALRERVCTELRADRFHHATLLTGARGCGKRSVGRALAMALLCENAGTRDLGCGECGSCERVRRGLHGDFQVLQRPPGKTQIPVDQVRELLELFSRASVEGRGRVALLEDVEQLGREGQNALLKTLEEPGSKRWLVASTSRPELLLDTVRSRMRRLPVPSLPESLLAGELERRIGLVGEEASSLARIAQGSLGQALELHAEGLEVWRARLAPVLDSDAPDAGWAQRFFAEIDTGEEGLRQAKRARLERGLALALVLRREQAAAGESRAWSEIEAILEARRRSEQGLAPELVLRALGDELGALRRA